MDQYGVFICGECERKWASEIPPMDDWYEWPRCCGQEALLVDLLIPRARMNGLGNVILSAFNVTFPVIWPLLGG